MKLLIATIAAASASGTIFTSPSANVGCAEFTFKGKATLACGRPDWPKGSTAVLFDRKSVRIYTVGANQQLGKLLWVR